MRAQVIDRLTDDNLRDTPIGRCAVIVWGGGAAVAVVEEDDPERVKRIIHQLEPGENPLNAIYGKRVLEQANVRAAYAAQDDRKAASAERDKDLRSKDFRREVTRALQKDWTGTAKDTLAAALMRGRR